MAYFLRRKCIDVRNEILPDFTFKDELVFLDDLIEEAQKSYQYWHHRRSIVEISQEYENEKSFTASVFAQESKNFHCWCYRIWVIRRFDLFEGELDFAEEMLKKVCS